jgi:hypothetical protein
MNVTNGPLCNIFLKFPTHQKIDKSPNLCLASFMQVSKKNLNHSLEILPDFMQQSSDVLFLTIKAIQGSYPPR